MVVGGYYLFLLDLQTMDHNSVERSKEFIREFLYSKIDSRDQTMLATIRPQFRVDEAMTQDFSKLEAALDRISYRHEKASLERFAERVDYIFSTGGPRPLWLSRWPSWRRNSSLEIWRCVWICRVGLSLHFPATWGRSLAGSMCFIFPAGIL